MDNITGKRILLLCENFYDYDIAIRDELLKLGAKDVYLHGVKFFKSSFRERENFSWFSFIRHPRQRYNWTQKFKEAISDKQFDVFLCIENACFTKDFMGYLREKNPGIKCILFLWDTYRTQQGGFKDYRFLFDKVYSFDRDDAEEYGLEYFPDFYIPQEKPSQYKYDLSFVGTANGSSTIHRFDLLEYIYRFCEKNGLETFLYLKTTKRLPTKNPLKLFNRAVTPTSEFEKYKDKYESQPWFHYTQLPLCECNEAQSQSKVLLDLNHKDRQGMTINAITALAHGQKLVTTNKRIKDEPFFNPNMIYIMEDENPQLDIEFWNRPNEPIDLSYLRIDNWLKHILI